VKSPKILTRLLGTLLLCVWGAVGYQVYTAALAPEPDHGEVISVTSQPRSEPYVYKADVNDPFQLIVPKVVKPVKPPTDTVWTPPPVKITGILKGHGGMTAILESAGGDVSFLGEGDTSGGVKILKIREGVVVYSYRKAKKEWTVDGRQ